MITTHILDTNLGKPAQNVEVRLYHTTTDTLVGTEKTNADGRISEFTTQKLDAGHYQLIFEIEPYFSNFQLNTFFPQVSIQFYIHDAQAHYHIPLLISPYAYSTYRGS